MSARREPAHVSRADWDDLDIPELTDEDFARMRPAREVFPALDFPKPKVRGRQRAPTKLQTTIRLDRDVLEHFRASGRGWQSRMNAALKRVVEQEKKRAGR